MAQVSGKSTAVAEWSAGYSSMQPQQIDLTNAESYLVEAIPLTMDYDDFMSASLLKTNPYLRDPKARAAALRISAASSSAIEGIRKPFEPDPRTAKVTSAPRKAAKSGR